MKNKNPALVKKSGNIYIAVNVGDLGAAWKCPQCASDDVEMFSQLVQLALFPAKERIIVSAFFCAACGYRYTVVEFASAEWLGAI